MDTKKKISVAVCRASGAAFLAFILSSCGDEGPVDPIQNPGDFNRAMRSGGLDRVYDVHVPATVNPSQPSPLVIMLHGVPRLSGMAVITGFDGVADRFGYIVAYPRAFQTLDWNVGCELCSSAAIDDVDDVRFIRDLIDDLAGQVAIDRSRVYVAGFSQGALMTHFLGCELANEIAAFGSVAATMIDEVEETCSPSRAAPWLFIQGTEDTEFPWEGRVGELSNTISARATIGSWAGLNGCSANGGIPKLFRRVGAGFLHREWRRSHVARCPRGVRKHQESGDQRERASGRVLLRPLARRPQNGAACGHAGHGHAVFGRRVHVAERVLDRLSRFVAHLSHELFAERLAREALLECMEAKRAGRDTGERNARPSDRVAVHLHDCGSSNQGEARGRLPQLFVGTAAVRFPEADLAEHLGGQERGRPQAMEEVVDRDRPVPLFAPSHQGAVEGERCGRNVGGGVGVRQTAADRPEVPHLEVPHRGGGFRETAADAGPDEIGGNEIGVVRAPIAISPFSSRT
jgi:polyhydroxybutyrate depolymerase